MSAPVKTIAGAYGMAVVGLLLGIFGMQRFYLRLYLSATLQTVILLAGLFILIWELVVHYHGLLTQLTASLSAGATYQSIPDLTSSTGSINTDYGYALCAIGGAWWLVDLFLIPSLVRKFNEGHGK